MIYGQVIKNINRAVKFTAFTG